MKTLLLIDTHALIHRFFHALPPLTTPDGQPIGAIYGICGVLIKIFKEQKPDYIAACFDTPEITFREEQFKEYKAHRPPAPNELISQIKRAPEVFDFFGIRKFAKPGFEADDLIGTLAEKFKNHSELAEGKIVIVSGDLDLLQLVDDDKVLAQISKTGITETVIYDEKAVEERYGLKPNQLNDLKGFLGDQSDNIPGVNGIGPKTATPLIKEFGSVEGVYDNLMIIPEKIVKKIKDHQEIALMSKKLATIKRDVPLEVSLEDLRAKPLDKKALSEYFEKLGFKSLPQRL